MKVNIVVACFVLCILGCAAQKKAVPQPPLSGTSSRILAGAERINVYLPLIKGKRIGIFANQTSMVGDTHLVDTLQKLGVDIINYILVALSSIIYFHLPVGAGSVF